MQVTQVSSLFPRTEVRQVCFRFPWKWRKCVSYSHGSDSSFCFVFPQNPSNLSEHGDLTATISFCPQRDVILGHLTVEEHVYIAALLRGITWDSMEDKVRGCCYMLTLVTWCGVWMCTGVCVCAGRDLLLVTCWRGGARLGSLQVSTGSERLGVDCSRCFVTFMALTCGEEVF